ncbi:hypothetical protein KGF57_003713 [Candida theae]|uniref:Uncharacterized protein n=1 Tax=Candida theae TaxID=1198502 RepID=A0AAD5FXS2_9ASCO|nr:uncharacterized protein KGF57_003713 [Candida theae]KAI5955580.1 hypothetical protein KGF57_003713 [Candida theae]
MASQSVPMDELKNDLNVAPDHENICNGNVTDMEVVVGAETKFIDGHAKGDVERTANGDEFGGDVDGNNMEGKYHTPETGNTDKENETPEVVSNVSCTKINDEATTKQSERQSKKPTKNKRRSSASSIAKHKRPKPKPVTTSTTTNTTQVSTTVSAPSSTKFLFGLLSHKNYQIRNPVVAFDTSLEASNDWLTWIRLELLELMFDSTWKEEEDGTAAVSSNQPSSLSQVFGEFALIGVSLGDYAFRFSVVLAVAVVKLYLHLICGLIGVALRRVGLGGKGRAKSF